MTPRFAILTAHGDVVSEHARLYDAVDALPFCGDEIILDREWSTTIPKSEIDYWRDVQAREAAGEPVE